MKSSCALHVPNYTAKALRARGKPAVSRLTSRFRVASYCRRVDLVCDEQGIGGGGKHCDGTDAQPDVSAAETSTATTTMHNPTAFHTAGVAATCATLTRLSARTTKLSVPQTILPRRYAPAASLQSSYLTPSGCQLLSQGRPGVRLARHQRRWQALRRKNGISGVVKHCDDYDAQPGASAAATRTANTTMHNPTAFHTAGVTATCATLARLSTRTT
jgi:hypothetical protein